MGHTGEDLIRRSDSVMSTDRLHAIVTRLVSVIGQSGTPPRPAWFLSCTSKNPNLDAPVAATCVSWRTMIATCANPACNVPFRYFRTGKIFILEANDADPSSRADLPKRRIEYFWLCGKCAPAMHLMRMMDGAVAICQPSRPPDPLVALRIAFAHEATPCLRAPRPNAIST